MESEGKKILREIKEEVEQSYRYLGLTKDEYSKMIFDFGIEYSTNKKIHPQSYLVGLYWFFLELELEKIIIYYSEVLKNTPSVELEHRMPLFLAFLRNEFEFNYYAVKCINDEAKKSSLKQSKAKNSQRVPKIKNN
jgi:hypothetical protein